MLQNILLLKSLKLQMSIIKVYFTKMSWILVTCLTLYRCMCNSKHCTLPSCYLGVIL